jgi:hypothetical protein
MFSDPSVNDALHPRPVIPAAVGCQPVLASTSRRRRACDDNLPPTIAQMKDVGEPQRH